MFAGVGASCSGHGISTPGMQAAQARVSYPQLQPIWRKIDNKKQQKYSNELLNWKLF